MCVCVQVCIYVYIYTHTSVRALDHTLFRQCMHTSVTKTCSRL